MDASLREAESKVLPSHKQGAIPDAVPLQDKSPRKKILTIDKLRNMLAVNKITVKYNVISKDLLINIPGHNSSIENSYLTSYGVIYSKLRGANYTTDGLDYFLLNIGEENRFNPAAEWVTSKPWDGNSRLKQLYDTIKAEDNHAKEVLMFRWLVTCIAALFEERDFTAAGMLVLQGSQGLGKTWWFRRLFSNDIRQQVFKDSVTIDPHNKDDVKKCVRNWICELGEIDSTFRKSELAALKAFITTDSDVIRLPYDRKEKMLPRKTALCATVNHSLFLSDTTGNRRFWTIPCIKIDSYHTIDMQQVWAEVKTLYDQGERWELTDKERETVNRINLDHEILDFASEKVKYFYNWANYCQDWKTAAEIAEEMGMKNPSRSDLISIAFSVLQYNGGHKRRSNGKNLLKVPLR